jgi:hypothetical protein
VLSEGVKIGEIHGRMAVQHGDNCKNQKIVYEWVEILEKVGEMWLTMYVLSDHRL